MVEVYFRQQSAEYAAYARDAAIREQEQNRREPDEHAAEKSADRSERLHDR